MGVLHALRVKSPYQLLRIEDIRIDNKPNEHGYLYLKCLIDDSINFQSAINASTSDKICIYEETEDENASNESPVNINVVKESKSKILFNGIVQNIKTSNVNGVYYLEIQALTSSFELDIKEKSRSFQNANMTYDELIGILLKDYSGYSFTQCTAEGQTIGKTLFQYKETDWNFLKRIASELNSELFCDIMETRNMFYFGRPIKANYEIEDMGFYKAHKNLKRFHEAGGIEAGHDTDYFYYEIERREKYEVGDNIRFKNKELYVNQYSAYALKDEVIYKYRLCRKNGIWQTKIYNSLLSGGSLEGKVAAVEGEKVKLHLDIDKGQNKEAVWFPYAPPTGNAMYSMPIVGTSARLYFSNESSEVPIVTGCVRKNGSSCAKTSDTTKRYFGTEHGSEIEMTPGAVNIKGGSKEPLSISFDDNVGVTLKSPKKLSLNADGEIIIKTPQSVSIKAQSQILAAKTGTQSGFSIENEFHFLGDNVIKNGSDREAYPPFDDEPKAGQKIEKKQEKKGFSWGRLAVGVLAAVAVAAVVVTCGVGAVLLGAAIGTCIGAACAVVSTAISDKMNGTQSSLGTYAKNALKGALTGAVSGAIFGPFGGFSSVGRVMAFGGINGMVDSILNQAIDGKFSLKQTLFDGLIGAATGGLLHGAGKLISKVSPYVTKSIGKVLSNLSSGAKNILSKVSGKADDILGAFSKTSRELFEKAANKVDNVVTSIKNSAQDLVDRAANKFNEVTARIDNKVDDLLRAGASKLDDGVNAINQARYNVRKALGLEEQVETNIGRIYANNPPEETSYFKNQISKMTEKGKSSFDKNIDTNDTKGTGKADAEDVNKETGKDNTIESKFVDISDNFDLDAAKTYERKIDNSKYFYHDEGDFGEEVAKKVAMDNNLGADVSSMFQSGRNGIDGAFLSKGPPPKLTMIKSKASRKGEFSYSDEQKLGGEKYFEKMMEDGDKRYKDFLKNLKKIKKMNPGLQLDYIRVETKIKITKTGFGVDELKIKDWTKAID